MSYPVDLRVLQQELHYLRVASSGCKVQRGAELAIEQVRVTVALLQQQLGCFDFTVPGWKQTNTSSSLTKHGPMKTKNSQMLADSPARIVNRSPVVTVQLLD